MAILTVKPAAWENYVRMPPAGYRPITDKEALSDKAILTGAREFINRQVKAGAPIGTSEPHVINGKMILFTVEPHYHEPNGPTKPWGWHKGATTFIKPAAPPVTANLDEWGVSYIYGETPTGVKIGATSIKR